MISSSRFQAITSHYPKLRVAVIGDYCLDRYLEIDPGRTETSIETGLPVYNVTQIRSQPGGAGTILNNLVALGLRDIFAVGFCGEDGEGWELRRALLAKTGVKMDFFLSTSQRRTFTYTKPLLMEAGKAPVELNRLDIKNWTPTPPALCEFMQQAALRLAEHVDALILLDQVDQPETGVVTCSFLKTIGKIVERRPELLIIADSRRGLVGFPQVTFKMNRAELAKLGGHSGAENDIATIKREAAQLAAQQGRPVFVTLAEQGIIGADGGGHAYHAPALPVRGEIDVVGAGDAVTANLAAALAGTANIAEALQFATAAASVVIHQLGTTGTASVGELEPLLIS